MYSYIALELEHLNVLRLFASHMSMYVCFQKANLLSDVDDMDTYTLFVPTNAFLQHNGITTMVIQGFSVV